MFLCNLLSVLRKCWGQWWTYIFRSWVFVNPFPILITCVCRSGRVAQSLEWMLLLSQVTDICHPNCASQLLWSLLISQLDFSHSVSIPYGLVVTGVMQALCSPAVQKYFFFFCQQKYADAVLGWAAWELSRAPYYTSKAFVLLFSSECN